MHSQKMKYQEFLKQFSNCPPIEYKEVEIVAFRWVFDGDIENSFKPINLMTEPPPRMLDNSDLMCKGFGLSLFKTFEGSLNGYTKSYKNKRGIPHEDFIKEKGNNIAIIPLNTNTGVCGNFNEKSTHFTFHEYEGTDLTKNIVEIINIFDENGNFKR